MRSFIFVVLLAFSVITSAGPRWRQFLPHYWAHRSHAKVYYNGQLYPTARVYRSTGKMLLVAFDNSKPQTVYVVFPAWHDVGVTNWTEFYRRGGLLFSTNPVPMGVLMNPIKTGGYADLLLKERSAEFNTIDSGRVRVTW